MPFAHLAANATTTLRSDAPVILNRVVINTKGATANTLTLWDGIDTSTNATKIAVIDTTSQVGSLNFNCELHTGLLAVMATGTAADVTVIFDEEQE